MRSDFSLDTPLRAYQRSWRQNLRTAEESGREAKHKIRSGDRRWSGRRGVGRLNPRRETKIQGKIGDREMGIREQVTNRRKLLARKRRRRGRAALPTTKREEELSKYARAGDHNLLPRTTYGRWRCMKLTELDGR